MKLNKTNLSKIIKWSTSKFNPIRKEEVIKNILYFCKSNSTEKTMQVSTGTFTENNSWGWSYLITKLSNGKYVSVKHDITSEEWMLKI